MIGSTTTARLGSRLPLAFATAVVLSCALPAPTSAVQSGSVDALEVGELLRDVEVHLLMRTDLGDVHLAVDTLHAPVTASNFLRYVDRSLFTGGTFYRAVRLDNQPDDDVRIEVVQGGMDRSRGEEALPPIRLEGTDETGLRHVDGTLSMARSGPNSARAEFFVTIGDQPSLDAGGARNPDGLGFAAFGRVLTGMEVIRAIQSAETDGQYLVTRVGIAFVERVGPG